jgi:hypothetical protein
MAAAASRLSEKANSDHFSRRAGWWFDETAALQLLTCDNKLHSKQLANRPQNEGFHGTCK